VSKCDECGASVKAQNLKSHYVRVHPNAKLPMDARRNWGKSPQPMTRKGKWTVAVIAATVAIVMVVLVFAGSAPRVGPRPGDAAPDFSLVSTAGQTVALSGLRGRIVLLEFMDVDCPYCQQEAPILGTLHGEFGNVTFLSVDMNFDGPADTPTRIAAYQQQYGNPWSFMLDPNGARGVAATYGVTGTPTIFIIDSQGIVAWTHSGASDLSTLRSALVSTGA
jgi:peroxiredoxin